MKNKTFKAFPDEYTNVGIDFDGVIHLCSKGFHDGTIYDEPVEGSLEAIKKLSDRFNVVVYSAKARSDRPLVEGKTGQELIWEWLKKHNIAKYVSEVTAEKPRALFYLDDKAYRFTSWEDFFKLGLI